MNELIIIDGNSLANRAYYGVPPLSNSQGVVTNALYGFLNMVLGLLEAEVPSHVAVAFDISKRVFRHEQYEDYKANRKGMPEDLKSQMPLIREALELMNVSVLGIEGYEGDDIIGTVARLAKKEGLKAVIVSGDRDTFQLIDETTKVYYPRRGLSDYDVIDLQTLADEYELRPEQVVDMKGLMGDSSDNIPGVPGIGEKTAKKLIGSYGNMDNLYAHLEDFIGKKMGEKLSTYKEQAYLSKHLATIDCDVPLKQTIDDFKMKAPQVDALRAFYERLELKNLLAQLDQIYGAKEDKTLDVIQGSEIDSYDAIEEVLSHLEPGNLAILIEPGSLKQDVFALGLRPEGGPSYRLLCEQQWPEVVKLLEPLLESEETQLLTDDAKALCHALYAVGANPSAILWDAVLSDYLLHPEERDHSLDSQLYARLGITMSDSQTEAMYQRLEGLEKIQESITQELKDKGLLELYHNIELPLAFILSDMELSGVTVNVSYLKELKEEFDQRLQTIQDGIYVTAGREFNINSPKQLGQVLFEELKLPVIKKTKTGYSTNVDVLEALRDEHGIVEDILAYRQIAKLKSTYVDGLLALTDAEGKVHTTLNQTLTATGRLSSSEPNLQNIPVRTEEGRRIRQAFVPSEEGQVLVAADYSQIELRILAHMSQDKTLLNSFIEKEDIHRRTASEVFHIPLAQVTSAQRRAAKAVNFGIIYGQTDYGLARELRINRKEAQAYIDRYFERYPDVQAWINRSIETAREKGYVTTLFGRRRQIRDIHSKNFNLRSFAERTAVNTPIQGSAADIIKLAMIECDQRLLDEGFKAKMILQVHDELIFEAKPEEVGYLIHVIKTAMENVVSLKVPLSVDVKVGFNWQDMEQV